MKWLITGGCGFIGSTLFKRIADNTNDSIRIIDNLSVGDISDLLNDYDIKVFDQTSISSQPNGYEFIRGDICDPDLANLVCRGCDYVVHLAANTGVQPSIIDPRKDLEENVIGVFNYLNSARLNSIKKFIFASSGAPVGNIIPPIHEKVPVSPLSPYGASKLAGEGYCSAFFHSYGLETVTLRFSNVYGPRSIKKSSVIAKYIKKIFCGEPIEIYGDGKQTRDFIYVEDLVDAIILASKNDHIGGEIFQIATGKETSLIELINLIRTEFSKFTLQELRVINSEPLKADIVFNYSDTTKAQSILGWKSKTHLDEGLKNTIEYFKNIS